MKKKKNIFLNILLSIFIYTVGNLVFAYEDSISDEDMMSAATAYRKGVELVRSQNYDSAIESFQLAVKYNPKMTDAYYNIASIYVFQKRYDEAYNTYVKIIALNPNDYDSILQAAKISYNRKNYALAIKYLKYIPDDYSKYALAQQLYRDATEQFNLQKDTIARAKISTATKNNYVLIDNFSSPAGVVVDSEGNMFVACYSENSIVKYDKNETKTNFVKDYLLAGPIGLAIDEYDNIYVANYDGNNILKITKGGNVSIFMDKVSKPYFLYIKDDILYISEQGNNVVVKYNLASK